LLKGVGSRRKGGFVAGGNEKRGNGPMIALRKACLRKRKKKRILPKLKEGKASTLVSAGTPGFDS